MSVTREMPVYICHKEVHALKIKSIEDGPFTEKQPSQALVKLHFHEDGYGPIEIAADWYYRHKPIAGGYYVVYEDGYSSFSPAKAFESGYTLKK